MKRTLNFGRYTQRLWHVSEHRIAKKAAYLVSVLALLVVGVPFALSSIGQLAYQSKDYTTAQRVWRLTSKMTWYDQDVPVANAGLAYYRVTQLDQAADQLERALKIAAPSRACKIHWNLAIVLSQRGDTRSQSLPNDAIGDYARGVNILDDQTCLDDPEYKENFQQLSSTLTQKMDALIQQIKDQHTRPTDDQDKNKSDTTTSDEDKAKDQNKALNDYQHDIYDGRYDQQTEEEKSRGYQENAW